MSILQQDKVANLIYEAILSKKLNPGVKLTESVLQQEFGFSRNLIRESFAKLASIGILNYEKYKGVSVVVPKISEIKKIFQARKIIEAGIIKIVVKKNFANLLDLTNLEDFVAEEKRYFDNGDIGKQTRKSCEFHLFLAKLSENDYLVNSLQPLIPLSALSAAIYSDSDSKTNFCSYSEHEALIDAIKSNDKTVAVRMMDNHLEHCVSHLNFKLKPKQKTSFSNIYS